MCQKTNHWERRRFLGKLSKAGLFGVVAFTPFSLLAEEREQGTTCPADDPVFLTLPYLQALTPVSVCINWIANKYCHSWVEYGEGGQLHKKAFATTDGLVTASNRVKCIERRGLKRTTKYNYKVVTKEMINYSLWITQFGATINRDDGVMVGQYVLQAKA